jgi:uncharacterized protein
MAYSFAEIAFTPTVRRLQEALGSRQAYARIENGADSRGATLGPQEAAFLAERDSFYLATVSETGWPYIQHRGGPSGFVRVLDEKTLGFADFAGNRQYVSVGNLQTSDKVSLFFMDYAGRSRLKVLGRAEVVAASDPVVVEKLGVPGYRARVERGVLIHVEAFDWNCPQHITPRFTLAEVEAATAPLRQRIEELEARLKPAGD